MGSLSEVEIEKWEDILTDTRGMKASDAGGGHRADVEGSNSECLERHGKGVVDAAFPGRHKGPTQLSRTSPGPSQVGV
ncbi:hypothetical protein FF1_030199 [Malus domestica]